MKSTTRAKLDLVIAELEISSSPLAKAYYAGDRAEVLHLLADAPFNFTYDDIVTIADEQELVKDAALTDLSYWFK